MSLPAEPSDGAGAVPADGAGSGGAPALGVDELPGAVRQRLARLACEALGRLPSDQVPPSLRRAASFAPSRRVKIVGSQVLAAVDDDDEFRARLAHQVSADETDLLQVVRDVEGGDPAPSGVRAAEAAALAYLVTSPAARPLVDVVSAVEQVAARADSELEQSVERLQQQLSRARGDLREQRDKHRGELDQLKNDNQQLRRTLGQTRADLKAARAETEEARSEAERARRRVEDAQRQADAEVRRLRARVSELEQDAATVRRETRVDRDLETARLRLLLDTVVGAASGLRRELALGPAETLPADLVEARAVVGEGRSRPSALQDDPRLLRRWLELPRAHLVVDGYNVSKTAWPSSPLDQQRTRLVSAVGSLVAGSTIEATVVFDGAEVAGVPAASAPRGVRVRFSPAGVIADDTIRQLVEAEPAGRVVVVVSSDRELAESVVSRGARSATSATFLAMLGA